MSRTRILLALCGVMAFAVSVCAQPQPGSPWPMLRRDQYHTGRSPYNGPETSTIKWVFETGRNSSSPAVSADGTIYLATRDEHVYAINPDGSEKWQFLRNPGGSPSSSPAIGVDGTIYVGSGGSLFYAINPDGSEKWTYDMGSLAPPRPSPTIGQDGRIYVSTVGTATMYAFNPDGTVDWSYTIPTGVFYDTPSIDTDGNIYIQADDGYLYAFSSTGSLLWQYNVGFSGGGYRASTSFSVKDSTVYTGSIGDTLYALSPEGSLKWIFETGEPLRAAPVMGDDGTLYFGSDRFYALGPDGNLKWSFPTPAGIWSSAAIDSDGTIYFGTMGADTATNRAYALNPDGSLLWDRGVSDRVLSCPVLGADGTLYIGTEDGKLYAFGTPTGTEERQHLRAFRYELRQNSPNPFYHSTAISYSLPAATQVVLSIHDITGRLVETLVNETQQPGLHQVNWSGKTNPSGVYFYSIKAGKFVETRKMVVVE